MVHSWQTVYSGNLAGGYGGTFFTENIDNRIYCTLNEELRLFNGTSFVQFAVSANFLFIDIGFSGSSPGNIFISGFDLGNHKEYMYNYNGSKWSKEFIENEDFQNFTIFYTSDRLVYALSYNYNDEKSIVLKGVRK